MDPLPHRIAASIPSLDRLHHQPVLVVGPSRSGKIEALRAPADGHDWRLVNVNLSLSEQLLSSLRTRALRAPRLLLDLYPP